MATMATGHGLSVLTNSCVKSPLNPITGRTATILEHDSVYSEHSEEEDIHGEELKNRIQIRLGREDNATVQRPFDEKAVAAQLGQLSDEEFYARLVQLRNEQRKILEVCERQYKEKVNHEKYFATRSYDDTFFDVDSNKLGNDSKDYASDGNDTDKIWNTNHNDSSYYLSKPPTGKSVKHAEYSRSTPQLSRSSKLRPSSAPARRSFERYRNYKENDFDHYPDEENWSSISSPMALSDKVSADVSEKARARIDDMWESFSVEDYAPRHRRHSSASILTDKDDNKILEQKNEWRHRITIPQPFRMTLRESSKKKTRTAAQEETHQRCLEKARAEELECQKKFKAQPVPAHVYLPLYDDLKEKSEARRRYVREYCKELLKSQIRPFNFDKRESDKHRHRCKSASASPVTDIKKNVFKASVVPDFIFDNSINEKMKEEEEYRKIRIKLRSEELIRASSLPSSMEARQKLKEQKAKERALAAKNKHKIKTRSKHEVPNYEALYRQFQAELARRKEMREATITQPFNLETSRIHSKQDKIIKDIERDNSILKETRWPYQSSRSRPRKNSVGRLSTSLDSIPAKSTTSADLRTSATRQWLNELSQREQQELENEKRRRRQQWKTQRLLQEQAGLSPPPKYEKKIEEKLRKYKSDERQREEEYQRELEEMKERVEKRPFLFKQQIQKNAQRAAEKKYATALRNAGLDEEFVHQHSSTLHNMQSAEEDDETGRSESG